MLVMCDKIIHLNDEICRNQWKDFQGMRKYKKFKFSKELKKFKT